MSFLAILDTLNLKVARIYQKSKIRTSKIGKNVIFGPCEFAKISFHINRSGGKMIKFLQGLALTSHFESFWSIVQSIEFYVAQKKRGVKKQPSLF